MTAVASRTNTFTLSAPVYYTSETVFEKEIGAVFGRQWLYAGHMSQLPRKGSYITFNYGGEEVLIIRGAGDTLHAHYNLCRHRGYPICEGPSGHVRALVCPYHQWRFDFDGTLRNVPNMGDGEYFAYRDHALRSVHVDAWNGIIFVHLGAGQPVPLADYLAGYRDAVTPFDPANSRIAHEERWVLDANWKVIVENALECYHCPGSHDTFCGVVDVPALTSSLNEWLDDAKGSSGDAGHSGVALKRGMQTMTADGTLSTTKLLGSCTSADAERGATAGMMLSPNYVYFAFYVDHWWTHATRPISATQTELVYTWHVRSDVEDSDVDLDKLIKVGYQTTVEDNPLCEKTYAGIRSRHYTPGPLVDAAEPALHDFARSYQAHMAIDAQSAW